MTTGKTIALTRLTFADKVMSLFFNMLSRSVIDFLPSFNFMAAVIPLDCKEIQLVHSEGDQPWDFFGRNDAKAEIPILWPSCEELTHWKRLRCWEGLRAEGEGDDRG